MPFVVVVIIKVFPWECLGMSNDLYLLDGKLVTSTTGWLILKVFKMFWRLKMLHEGSYILYLKMSPVYNTISFTANLGYGAHLRYIDYLSVKIP